MELAPSVHVKLNQIWCTLLDRKQWSFKFSKLWSKSILPKLSTHLWLILHKGLWTGERALKAGIGDGICKRCRHKRESIHHLFMGYPHSKQVLSLLNKILIRGGREEVTWKQLLLGDSIGVSSELWNSIRSCFLWHTWLQRNAVVFQSESLNFFELTSNLSFQVRKVVSRNTKVIQARKEFLKLGKNHMQREVIWSCNRHIVYNDWNEELLNQLASSEAKDKELVELCLELATLYKSIDAAAHPRVA